MPVNPKCILTKNNKITHNKYKMMNRENKPAFASKTKHMRDNGLADKLIITLRY
jgi:hypothetical protein